VGEVPDDMALLMAAGGIQDGCIKLEIVGWRKYVYFWD